MPIDLDIKINLQGTLIARINNAAKAGVRDLMDNVVLPAAREMSPKGTIRREGAVSSADSLSTLTRIRGNRIEAFLRSNSGHGGFLEKGTSKMAARPYMQPAFERALPELNSILKARFDQLAELDEIADGGVEALQVAVETKKFKRPRSRYRAKTKAEKFLERMGIKVKRVKK
jgi:hypothetical protein